MCQWILGHVVFHGEPSNLDTMDLARKSWHLFCGYSISIQLLAMARDF